MLKKIKLNYDWSYFLPPMQDYSIHKGTCLAHQLDELTDIHEEYGLGETYTKEELQELKYIIDSINPLEFVTIAQVRDMIEKSKGN